MAIEIRPLEGLVAVRPLETKSDQQTSRGSGTPEPANDGAAELAVVVVAGAKTQVKAGDTVFIRPGYMSWGTKIDDETIVIDQYAIVARVSND